METEPDDEQAQDTPEEAIPEEPVILEEIISEEPVQQIPEEPVQEEAAGENADTPVEEEEEWRRVETALRMIRKAMPEVVLSLDTYRVEVARRALDTFGEIIINDVSGGDEQMYGLVKAYDVPYIITGRPYSAYEPSRQWLDEHDLERVKLFCLNK